MKKISVLLAFLTLLIANVAFAQGAAVVTSLTGTAQVQTASASPRALRQGDEVRQGDTVSTGGASSLVLKFDDGEVAALSQNSRMTITAYQFQPEARTGNVLLSLITGGMRAVTGLIGRNQPERVAYRAATATIGIRGTDVSIGTNGTDVEVHVNDGTITLTLGSQTITLGVGETAYIHNNVISRTPPAGFAAGVTSQLQSLQAMADTINTALNSGTRSEGAGSGTGSSGSPGAPPSGGGGGSASIH
jgi:hypothetical protein